MYHKTNMIATEYFEVSQCWTFFYQISPFSNLQVDWMKSMGEMMMGFPKSCCDFSRAETRETQCHYELSYQVNLLYDIE